MRKSQGAVAARTLPNAYCKRNRLSSGEAFRNLVKTLKEDYSGGVTSPAWNITELLTQGAYQVIS
jgi:hypothetical protein